MNKYEFKPSLLDTRRQNPGILPILVIFAVKLFSFKWAKLSVSLQFNRNQTAMSTDYFMVAKTVFAGLASVSALCIGAFWKYQNKLVYTPQHRLFGQKDTQTQLGPRQPSDLQLYGYSDISIPTLTGQTLSGWFIPTDTPKDCRTIVYLPEDTSNLRTHLEFLKKLVVKTNSNVFIVGYRTAPKGQSITEQSVKEDAETIVSYVTNHPEIDAARVNLYGRGLGGAVAIHIASLPAFRTSIHGVVLENTFASIDDMLLDKLGRLGYIARLFSANCWDSRGSIVNLQCPILFIKSLKDEVIPSSQMDILIGITELFEMDVTMMTLDNGTHRNSWQVSPIKYFTQVNLFLEMTETATATATGV